MDKYLEAEKQLAELLGWKNISIWHGAERIGEPATLVLRAQKTLKYAPQEKLPQWCRDNAAAFALMVKHAAQTFYFSKFVTVEIDMANEEQEFYSVNVIWSDHPDKEAAVRYAIVQAVIAMLKAK